jgi:uncharacterized protein
VSATSLLSKAQTALRSARLLVTSDPEAAADRAYYATFHAARAALEVVAPTDYPVLKTHSSVISAFGRLVVLRHGLDRNLGRILNALQDVRIGADYSEDVFCDAELAADLCAKAETFVNAVIAFLESHP